MVEQLGAPAHLQDGVFIVRPCVARSDGDADAKLHGAEGLLEKDAGADPALARDQLELARASLGEEIGRASCRERV